MLQLKNPVTFVIEMNNTRFSTTIHILTLLAAQPDEWLSSEYIAGSITVNPVIVRKELSILNDAGLVISKKGKDGGVQLGKDSDKILLSEIYLAVKSSEVLGRKNQHPNPACPIGNQINDKLEILFSEVDQQVISYLSKKTLSEFFGEFM